ncbi:hypothetical protein C8R43DRAFT_351785 [Mycena crocata]|nr:hypothetical protein C8R43DRAFT_351785 [Mycena crocata]
MSASALAQELLDNIVEHVDERATLKACALAGTALVAPSQRSLFSTVGIGRESSQIPELWDAGAGAACFTTFERFLAFITSSPRLGSYVQSLSVYLTTGPSGHMPEPTYAQLIAILTATPNIRQLGLSPQFPFSWRNMSPELISLLREIYTRPAFRSLALSRIKDVPSSLITFATSFYRELSIAQCYIRDDIAPQPSHDRFIIEPQETAVKRYVMDDLQLTFQGAEAPIDEVPMYIMSTGLHRHLHRLRRLKLSGNAWYTANLRRFMLQLSLNSLEDLELTFSLGFPDTSKFGLPALPALRLLHIYVHSIQEILPDEFEPLLATLTTCTPVLECLTVTLNTLMRQEIAIPTEKFGQWPVQAEAYTSFQSRNELEKALPKLRMVRCVHFGAGQHAFGHYARQKFSAAVENNIFTL